VPADLVDDGAHQDFDQAAADSMRDRQPDQSDPAEDEDAGIVMQ